MTRPAATSNASKRHPIHANQLSARRVAKVAAEMTRRHLACLNHLTALAKSVQRSIPQATGGKDRGCVRLVQQLVESADLFKKHMETDDLAFALVATDNLQLLDEDVRSTALGIPETATWPK